VLRPALTLALLLPALDAVALDRPLGECTVEVWRAKDGLPGDAVRALAQTSDHRLWAATLGGLARFDGRTWTPAPVPAAWRATVSDAQVLHAAGDGSVWSLGPRRAPFRMAGGGGRVFTTADGAPAEGHAITEGPGALWLAGPQQLYLFTEGHFALEPAAGLDGAISALAVASDGGLWVGTSRGLYARRGGALVRVLEGVVTALHRDRAGTLWAAAGGRLLAPEGGLSFDPSGALPAGAVVTALAGDADGNLWIGTTAGLLRLRDRRFTRFTSRDGLPEDDVTTLLVDREESLWVGTRRGGLAQFTDRTLHSLRLLDGVELESVCEAEDGALWFASRYRGLARLPPGGELTWFGPAQGLPGNSVHAVLPAGGDAVWIGAGRGLARYARGKIEASPLWPRFVTGLYQGRGGALWIAGNGELGRLDGKQLTLYRPADGLPAGQLRSMGEDPTGHLWVSAIGGLVRLEDGRFVAAHRDLGGVRSMLTTRDGNFWLTTVSQGLLRLTPSGLQRFDARAGLDPDRLAQLLEDEAGDLWIGAHNKIVRVSRASLDAVSEGRRSTVETLAFEGTDRRAGVIAERVRQPSAWRAHDGRLWFITDQGPVFIDPRGVRRNELPPVVEVESAALDGRSALGGTPRLPAGAGRLVVQFTAVTLRQAARVRYRHRLEGHDREWIEDGAARTASYASLGPGRYWFTVQASNADGVWNERGASFAFVLVPPFYRSTWFLGGCGLALLGLVIAAHRARVARLRAEYALLVSERARMARELHDTLLQGMTAAALQVGAMRAEAGDAPQAWQNDLASVQDLITRCLRESREAVWGLRDRNATGDLGASLERMARRLCGAQAISCTFHTQGTPVRLGPAVEDELHRIAGEAIANALRHAGARSIEGRLCYDGQSVTLTISDDGTGFDASASPPAGHFGLAGMRERAARIGAKLEIRSGPGTTIEVRVERS
jgi:signal transduction histidine kinase